MSTNSGQALVPYPWQERKKFNDSRRLISPVVKLTRTLAWVATVTSPLSFLAWMWAKFAFRRYNDSWYKRGLVLLASGAIASLVFARNPLDIPMAWYDMLRSFGTEAVSQPIPAIIHALLITLPYALILQGFHALARTYQIEKTTNAFLQAQRPTAMMRLRKHRNIKTLSRGIDPSPQGDGYVRFGVIVHDRIQWRRSRYGMIVEKKIKKMGHGAIIGASGMGKTTAAETFTHYVLLNDSGMIYIDFKADIDTMRGLAAIARNNDRPCYILDIGFGTTDTSWYDLFAWAGSPADKASVLVECLQFAEGEGGEAFYRGIAESWLPMQIEAAEILGLEEDEGMFDFLLDTAVPARFRDRIEPLRESSDAKVLAKFERWDQEAKLVKASDLQSLRNELSKITNAAGGRLKANPDNPNPVSMRDVMDSGGLIYIGIAAGINDVVVKVLGSFLFRELSILVSERSRMNKETLRDVFVIPDEASEMEERSVLMNPLYTMSRGSRVWMWPSFQSYAVWDESTQEEIQSNARNYMAFDIPALTTAEKISTTISSVFALKQMAQEETRQQAFQNQTIGIGGEARLEIVTDSFLRPNIELAAVPPRHAYIWFKDGPIAPRQRWWGRNRVRKDENRGDAPLVKIVPYSLVMSEGSDPTADIISDAPEAIESVVLPDDHEARDTAGAVPHTERIADTSSGDDGATSRANDWQDKFLLRDEPRPTQSITEAVQSRKPKESPAEHVDAAGGERKAEPSGPPSLPSFAVRGARRRRDAAGDDLATSVASEPVGDSESSAPLAPASPGSAFVEGDGSQSGAVPAADASVEGASDSEVSGFPAPWVDDEFADDGAGDGGGGSPVPEPEATEASEAGASLVSGSDASASRDAVRSPGPAEPVQMAQGEGADTHSGSASDGASGGSDVQGSGSLAVGDAPQCVDDSSGGPRSDAAAPSGVGDDEDSNRLAKSEEVDASVASDEGRDWFV